jgi:protein O-GlcNAc transferase
MNLHFLFSRGRLAFILPLLGLAALHAQGVNPTPEQRKTIDLAPYQQAALQNPNDPQAWSTLATAARWSGDAKVEQDAVQHMTTLQPSSAKSWNRMGELLRKQNPDASSAAYQNAVKADPKMAEAWHGLGLTQFDTGKLKEAVASLKKAVELQPTLTQAWNDLASVLEQLKEKAQAAAARMKAEQSSLMEKAQSLQKK